MKGHNKMQRLPSTSKLRAEDQNPAMLGGQKMMQNPANQSGISISAASIAQQS